MIILYLNYFHTSRLTFHDLDVFSMHVKPWLSLFLLRVKENAIWVIGIIGMILGRSLDANCEV